MCEGLEFGNYSKAAQSSGDEEAAAETAPVLEREWTEGDVHRPAPPGGEAGSSYSASSMIEVELPLPAKMPANDLDHGLGTTVTRI